MSKLIRVKLGYIGVSDKDAAAHAVAVLDGLTNNPNYANPPIDLVVFRTGIDTYASAIAAAIDGGKKAIADRNKQRTVVIKMMRQLGHWVEANCKDVCLGYTDWSDCHNAYALRLWRNPLALAAIEDPTVVEKILQCLALPSKPQPIAPAHDESRRLSADFIFNLRWTIKNGSY
jgi:hypothetical protein